MGAFSRGPIGPPGHPGIHCWRLSAGPTVWATGAPCPRRGRRPALARVGSPAPGPGTPLRPTPEAGPDNGPRPRGTAEAPTAAGRGRPLPRPAFSRRQSRPGNPPGPKGATTTMTTTTTRRDPTDLGHHRRLHQRHRHEPPSVAPQTVPDHRTRPAPPRHPTAKPRILSSVSSPPVSAGKSRPRCDGDRTRKTTATGRSSTCSTSPQVHDSLHLEGSRGDRWLGNPSRGKALAARRGLTSDPGRPRTRRTAA